MANLPLLFITTIYFTLIASKQLSKRSAISNEIDTTTNLEDDSDPSGLTIKAVANEVKAFQGETIELECEASGSPQPLIRFYKHGYDLSNEEILSNELSHFSSSGLVNAKGRLRFVARKSEVVFCKATNAGKSAQAPIKIFVTGSKFDILSNDVFDYELKGVSVIRKSPIINFFDTVYMDVIGSTVILPCSSSGIGEIDTIWLDGEEKVIDVSKNKRFAVTPYGHLQIRNIEWSDMGLYTCVVRNKFGKDSITTFLYPMLPEK